MSKIKGLDDFLDIVSILKDPNAYNTKVQELKGLIKQYTEVCEAVVKLGEVNDYTQNIKTKSIEASEIAAEAKTIAAKVISDAQEKANSILKKALEANQTNENLAISLAQKEKALNAALAEVETLKSQVLATKSSLEKEKEDVESLKKEFQGKTAKLLAAIKD